jgi:hypothetical protein
MPLTGKLESPNGTPRPYKVMSGVACVFNQALREELRAKCGAYLRDEREDENGKVVIKA